MAAWSGRHSTYRSVAFDRSRDNRALPNEAGRIQARNQTDARPLRKPRPADIPTLRIVQLMEYAVLPPPAGPGRPGQSKRKAGIEDAGSDQLRTQIHDRFGVDHLTIQMETPDFEDDTFHFCHAGTACFRSTRE